MKKQSFLLPAISIITMMSACKKNKETETATPAPAPAATNYPGYQPMKVGNYWIYQQFDVDTFGNATPRNVFDSCYVEKDTIINSQTYFKVVRPTFFYSYNQGYLRDSLHYIVDNLGRTLFSSQDFTTIFDSHYGFAASDTVFLCTRQMADSNMIVTTPAGTFTTLNFKTTYAMYPHWSVNGNPRFMHTRYAENVGIVAETIPFSVGDPNYIEVRLVSYHLN